MATRQTVIEVENLVVEYGNGAAAFRAVDGMSFSVGEGECVGFIGANGAGKSTTIKSLMGFLFPTSGNLRVFGASAGDVRSRRRIGYLPEVALYYPFMKAGELLQLYGGLQGLRARDLRTRIPEVLEKVGLAGREKQLLKNFSKGMQQRLGIAQALVAKPELLVFDELCSGLDPLGRHDLRQVLLDLKREGQTVFFSSHELSEVESLCDRVLIVHQGHIVRSARIDDFMQPLNRYHITFQVNGMGLPPSVEALHPAQRGETYEVVLTDVDTYTRALSDLASHRCRLLHTASQSRSLEDYFIDLVRTPEEAA